MEGWRLTAASSPPVRDDLIRNTTRAQTYPGADLAADAKMAVNAAADKETGLPCMLLVDSAFSAITPY